MVTINKSRSEHVESHGVIVAFDQVVTLPVKVNGHEATIYVGVTKLGRAAGSLATTSDVVEVAVRLVSGVTMETEQAVARARIAAKGRG